MFVLRFLLRTVLLGVLTRLLGAFLPLLRRLIRVIWR
jgi:cytochrome c biogenesis protein CcdA